MDKEERRKIIVDYIASNQACTAEQLIQGVKEQISRVPVYDILGELIKDGIVKDIKKNRRDHKLFVDNNNLVVSIPKELEQFQKDFYPLLDRVQKACAKHLNVNYYELIKDPVRNSDRLEKYRLHAELLQQPFIVFSELNRIYNFRSFLIWSSQIKDDETLKKLQLVVNSKLIEIQIKLINKLRHLIPESTEVDEQEKEMGILGAIGTYLLIPDFENSSFAVIHGKFSKCGMGKEAKLVLDHLLKIIEQDEKLTGSIYSKSNMNYKYPIKISTRIPDLTNVGVAHNNNEQ